MKIDAVTNDSKDDHLTMQAAYAPNGRLFSVVGSIDIFDRSQPDDYQSPTSGLVMYNSSGQMVQILQDGTVNVISYGSLEDAFVALLKQSLTDSKTTYGTNVTDHQTTLVDAARKVLGAIGSAI